MKAEKTRLPEVIFMVSSPSVSAIPRPITTRSPGTASRSAATTVLEIEVELSWPSFRPLFQPLFQLSFRPFHGERIGPCSISKQSERHQYDVIQTPYIE